MDHETAEDMRLEIRGLTDQVKRLADLLESVISKMTDERNPYIRTGE